MLTPSERKYLRGRAHHLEPAVFVGKSGVTDTVVASIEEALDAHELIKLRFVDHKEKARKRAVLDQIVERTRCDLAGLIGHVAILYRRQEDEDKRRIVLPGG